MARLDLEWLAVFDEVYKTASVSRAAERLGLAQAAASTALNKLRAHFDDRLFSRTARGMLPTPRAQALYPSLREVLVQLEGTRPRPSTFVPGEAQRTFRICMTDISEIVFLPNLLNHLRLAAPGVRIEVEKISDDSGRRLEEGEVDLAVGFMPQLEAGFYQQVLFAQNFVCLAAAGHPRIGARLGKAAYARESHVVVAASGTGHAIVDKVLARLHVERHVVLRVPSFLAVARIVAETQLIATVPLRYGQVMLNRERIRLLPVPHALPHYAVKQHWHERFHSDPGNAWLRRTVSELLDGAPAVTSEERRRG
ncbi:MAG: LysR family transcriptional regulator [Pseudomonadota bacterium]